MKEWISNYNPHFHACPNSKCCHSCTDLPLSADVAKIKSGCRCCSNYIFILDLTPGFNIMHKDNCKTRWETFKLEDLVRLILEIWWYQILIRSVAYPRRGLACWRLVALLDAAGVDPSRRGTTSWGGHPGYPSWAAESGSRGHGVQLSRPGWNIRQETSELWVTRSRSTGITAGLKYATGHMWAVESGSWGHGMLLMEHC